MTAGLCVIMMQSHVTSDTRPSRFSACNTESWEGPGDEAIRRGKWSNKSHDCSCGVGVVYLCLSYTEFPYNITAEVCFREPDLDIMDEAHKRSLNTDVLHKKGDNPLPN